MAWPDLLESASQLSSNDVSVATNIKLVGLYLTPLKHYFYNIMYTRQARR